MTADQIAKIVKAEIKAHEIREKEKIEAFFSGIKSDIYKMRESTADVVSVWNSFGTVGKGIIWFGKVCFGASVICGTAWAALHSGGMK